MNSSGLSAGIGFPIIFIIGLIFFLVRKERKTHFLQLRKQEEDFQNIAESLPQMVWSTDDQGQSKYFNNKWFEYFGLSPGNHNLNWRKFVHPEDLPRIVSRWARALEEQLPYENEYRLKGKDGRYRWFLSRGTPIKDKSQRIIKWMGTATDIHENKEALRLRDELLTLLDQEIGARKIQQAELEQAVKTRDEFMSMASHELKTPLTSLQLQTQMSKKIIAKDGIAGFSPEKLVRLIQIFDNQVSRLGRLVEDLLDVSKINQGRLPINLEIFDLGQLICEVVERFNGQSEKPGGHGISMSVKPVCGNFDRFRIEQVIINLLSNAIKYGGGSPIHVEVFKDEDLAKIIVSDRGPGIAVENQERIFKLFERAISPRQVSGLGLGLHIVNQIVTAHGGTIKIHSQLGNGCTFVIELPTSVSDHFNFQSPRPHLSAVEQI